MLRFLKSDFLKLSGLIFTALSISACHNNTASRPVFDESEEGFFVASNIQGLNLDTLSPSDRDLYHHVGYSLLVEQYEALNLPTMRAGIQANPPAGIVFWNSNRVSARELGTITRAYSETARKADKPQPPLLLSTDYEGGGLRYTTRRTSVPGIQRFTSGFTLLPHSRWLGKEIEDQGTDELCALQGQIMGKELSTAGINYPLATVADLAGNLFQHRGISRDPTIISRCLNKMIDQYHLSTNNNGVFVTKHFPGLGLTNGDTHDITVVSSRRNADFDQHILPYRQVLERRRELGDERLLSIMVGHARFSAFSNRTSTESSSILRNILKGTAPFEEQDSGVKTRRPGLGFTGLVLSDAMWMGVYGFVNDMALIGRITAANAEESARKLRDLKAYLIEQGFYSQSQTDSLSRADYQNIYNVLNTNALLAGIDILMVPNRQFAKLVEFYRKGVVGQWSDEEKRLLQVRTGFSAEQARTALRARLTQIIEKNRQIRSRLSFPAADEGGTPSSLTGDLRVRLQNILSELDTTWSF